MHNSISAFRPVQSAFSQTALSGLALAMNHAVPTIAGPEPIEPWQGTREATTTDKTKISYQLNRTTGEIIGSEDCLYLNVYTPKLPSPGSIPIPVMVFIHGGGFVFGNGTIKGETGPDFLLDHGVVVVTINYRLGLLGFLNLGILGAAGNMGLKDQIKALQWIQCNISRFGGDKNNVTIFGSSSGSVSCEFLMLSPLAKGLFHKCILHSGSTLNSWAFIHPKKSRKMVEELSQLIGPVKNECGGVSKALLDSSGKDLTRLAFGIIGKENSKTMFFGFVPSIEQEFECREEALTKTPYKLLKEGTCNDVPVIRGFCNKEGLIMKATKPNTVEELVKSKNFSIYWPYDLSDCDITKYNSKLIAAYIQKCKPDDEPEEFAINFFGDLFITSGVYLAGKLQCKKMPVYMYRFSYDGKLNKYKALNKLDHKGAGHSDEVGYILRHNALSLQLLQDADVVMRNRLTKMWTNFAKTGNPTPMYCCESPVKWPLFTEESPKYLNIDNEFTIECNYEPEKMSIFEEVMAKYEK